MNLLQAMLARCQAIIDTDRGSKEYWLFVIIKLQNSGLKNVIIHMKMVSNLAAIIERTAPTPLWRGDGCLKSNKAFHALAMHIYGMMELLLVILDFKFPWMGVHGQGETVVDGKADIF